MPSRVFFTIQIILYIYLRRELWAQCDIILCWSRKCKSIIILYTSRILRTLCRVIVSTRIPVNIENSTNNKIHVFVLISLSTTLTFQKFFLKVTKSQADIVIYTCTHVITPSAFNKFQFSKIYFVFKLYTGLFVTIYSNCEANQLHVYNLHALLYYMEYIYVLNNLNQ